MRKYEPAWHLTGPKPYGVQIEALRRSRGHERYGYWLEQGLGKTALAINDWIENFSDLDTIIVLCPNTFKMDWALAPAEWGVTNVTGAVWPKYPMAAGVIDNPRFNIMNFEAARGSGYDHLKKLLDSRPCLLIVDESSAIKNWKSQTARAVLDLCKRAKAVRLLNGTPMSQNVMDLFPQLKCLGELNGTNPYAFRNRFAVVGGYMGKQVIGVKNEEELHTLQARCSFRALKKDWSDLPEKIYVPLRLEMTNKQRKHYKEMMDDFITMVEGHEFTADLVLTQLDKARQIVSGILLDGDKFKLIEEPLKNPKIQAALDLMESGSGKMIISYFYSKMGDVLFETMKAKGLDPAFIRGQMKPEDVIEQKAKFNTKSNCRILLGQITATSRAHTLLGGEGDDRCHKMYFHDHTFSLLDRQQMEDRNHRGAQDRACLYYDPIMSPIDEAQLKALLKKQDLASLVVDAVRSVKTRGLL